MGENMTTEPDETQQERQALASAIASARSDARPPVAHEQVRALLRADVQIARQRLSDLGRN